MGGSIEFSGEYVKIYGLFYHSVVQTLLLYGSEIWVITAPIIADMEIVIIGFTRGLLKKIQRRDRGVYWANLH